MADKTLKCKVRLRLRYREAEFYKEKGFEQAQRCYECERTEGSEM